MWKYIASRMVQLAQWHASPAQIPCLRSERISVEQYHLPGLLWRRSFNLRDLSTQNELVSQSYHLWSLYKDKLGLISSLPLLATYLGDPNFPPAFNSFGNFSRWIEKGLVTLESLLHDSSFKSFSSPQRQYDLPHAEFLMYLQIRHYYLENYWLDAEKSSTVFERICNEASRDRGTISLVYKHINEWGLLSKSSARMQWEAEVVAKSTLRRIGRIWYPTCTEVLNLLRSKKQLSNYKHIGIIPLSGSTQCTHRYQTPVLEDAQTELHISTFFGAVRPLNPSGNKPPQL